MAEELPLPPLPKAGPKPPRPADGDTNPGVASTEYVKRKLRNANLLTRLVGAAVAAAVTAGLGFFFSARHEEVKTQAAQVDATSLERMVKVEQRLADHIDAENQRHAELLDRLNHGERMQATIDAKLDLELDQHHVPKGRRPSPGDFEPAGPPGERP
jgi:uncharacterized protein HemX